MSKPTGTIRLPITADTSTVLGSRVAADSVTWRGLNFDDARIDHWLPMIGHVEAGFLGVAFVHPDDSAAVWDGVRYRVRCRHEIGQRIHIGNRYAYVVSVEPDRGGDGWAWVIQYGARPAKETE